MWQTGSDGTNLAFKGEVVCDFKRNVTTLLQEFVSRQTAQHWDRKQPLENNEGSVFWKKRQWKIAKCDHPQAHTGMGLSIEKKKKKNAIWKRVHAPAYCKKMKKKNPKKRNTASLLTEIISAYVQKAPWWNVAEWRLDFNCRVNYSVPTVSVLTPTVLLK